MKLNCVRVEYFRHWLFPCRSAVSWAMWSNRIENKWMFRYTRIKYASDSGGGKNEKNKSTIEWRVMDFLRTKMESLTGMAETTTAVVDGKWYNWMLAIFANSFKDNVSVSMLYAEMAPQACSTIASNFMQFLFSSRSIGRLARPSLAYSLQPWCCSGLDGWTKVKLFDLMGNNFNCSPFLRVRIWLLYYLF